VRSGGRSYGPGSRPFFCGGREAGGPAAYSALAFAFAFAFAWPERSAIARLRPRA
jgi:hypothetical protein